MKPYISITKPISATPMTRQKYNDFRGWPVPFDEDGRDAGYYILHAGGYETWMEEGHFIQCYAPTQIIEDAFQLPLWAEPGDWSGPTVRAQPAAEDAVDRELSDAEVFELLLPLFEELGLNPDDALIIRHWDFEEDGEEDEITEAEPTPAGFSFSEALEMIKQGAAMARTGWNGSGMFIYLVQPGDYPAASLVAKAHWGAEALVPYGAYLAIKSVNGQVVPWLASQTDLLNSDWELVHV
jgi:hypothetical protein